MAKYQLLLPKMGESVAEATIIKWNKNPGDTIEADEAVMEIATDKVDSEVPSPVSGKLVEQLCNENDVVQVGAVIAIIETGEAEERVEEPLAIAEELEEVSIPEVPAEAPDTPEPIPGLEQLEQKPVEESTDSFKGSGRFYSPLVKNIAAQEGISAEELDKIPGTGAEGRLTKDDLLNYLQNPSAVSTAKPQQPVEKAPAPVVETPAAKPAETVQTTAPVESKPAPAVSV